MFSSWSPISALVAGVNIGRGELLGLAQSVRQLDPADRAVPAVVVPARARQVTPHDALDRQHREPLHDQRPPADLLRHPLGRRDQVVRHDLARQTEPEHRHPGQHLPLAGNRRRVHRVIGRDPVGGDHQDPRLTTLRRQLVDVTDLAGRDQREVEGGGHHPKSIRPGGPAATPALRDFGGGSVRRVGGDRDHGVSHTRRAANGGPAVKAIRIRQWSFDHVEYDAAGDVLYLSIGEPRPS